MSVSGSGVPSTSPEEDRDLQTALAQLDQALSDHKQWYKNLVRVLVVRLPPDEADLKPDAHHHCCFGQWYDREAMGALRDQPTFVALGEAHRTMHNCAAASPAARARPATRRRGRARPVRRLPPPHAPRVRNLATGSPRLLPKPRPTGGHTATAHGVISDLREQQALIRPGLQECTLAVIDIDHLAAINDRYGRVDGRRRPPSGRAVLAGKQTLVRSHLPVRRREIAPVHSRNSGPPRCQPRRDAPLRDRPSKRSRATRAAVTFGSPCRSAFRHSTRRSPSKKRSRTPRTLFPAKAAGRNCVEVFA